MAEKVTYQLNLNDLGLDRVTAKEAAMKEVGEYIKTEILDHVSNVKSPVKGGLYKTTLSPAYKKFKDEVADPIANLELTGDMLDSLEYKYDTRTGILEIGIFDSRQAAKADNHSKFTSESKSTSLPWRQFIPKNGRDVFRDSIISEAESIISGYTSEDNTQGFIQSLVSSIISGVTR